MVKMAGDRTGWGLLAIGVVAVGLWPLACQTADTGDASSEPLTDLTQVVLDDVGPEVMSPALADAQVAIDSLNSALAAWLDGGEREEAQIAYEEAMLVWQVVDVMRVAASADVDPVLLRDEVYSWPIINRCRVDQVIASGEYTSDIGNLLVNARGLDALEQLLYAGADNVCPSQVPPNRDGAWNALSADDLDAARAGYAVAIGENVDQQLDSLIQAWSEPDVPSLQAVMDGVFALESVIKDRKLGRPLGIVDCEGNSCIESVEGLAQSDSTEWVIRNLMGFRDLFTGGDGIGLDDLLIEMGEEAVVTDLLALTARAISEAEALDPNLARAIETQPAQAEALYATVDEVDEILRADVVTLLTLQLPVEISGDTD
ncbi:MAG: putative lipoprotein [Myxococcota bacterium]|jgi:predicted lipoprotein